ncbi:MAG: hypothetical protein VW803_06490, partial [Aquiluna sp.]
MTIWFPPLSAAIGFIASIGSNWIVVVAKTLAPMPLVRLHFVDGPFGILLAALFVIAIYLFYLA